jgi:hypothetical protein
MIGEVPDELRADLLYLSQVDEQMAPFIDNRQNLIYDLATRLLLEPGVVITDTAFLSLAEIAEDLNKNSQSWVWNGLSRGLIVPAFREQNVESFRDNWDRSGLQSQQSALIGMLPGSKETLAKLDSAIYHRQTPRITWPERVGVSFGNVMNEYFTRDDVDSDSWDSAKIGLWRRTRAMRGKYLELGWESANDPKVHGLRRSAVLQAIATDIGFSGDPADATKMIASAKRKDRAALRATILWIDELYHYNQASCFKVRVSFPAGKKQVSDAASMVQGLVWPGPGRLSDTSGVHHYNNFFLRWPGRNLLRRASPDKLLGIRTDEVGRCYDQALRSFKINPSNVTWDLYKVQAEKYATAICGAVGQRVDSGLGIKYLMRENGITLGTVVVASGATVAGGILTGGVLPITLSAVAGGAALYIPIRDFARAKQNPDTINVKVAGSKHGSIQIDLPTSR